MEVFSKRILTDSELSRLNDYTFKPGKFTLADKIMLKILWEPVTRRLPLWVSPNILTLLGGLSVFLMSFMAFYYVPNFKAQSVPPWTSLLSAFLVFFYTTLDGIDGMQARRLRLESPLGQLLDHGTDGLVTSIFCYFTFLIHPNGYTWVNGLVTISALINTSAVNWREENFGEFSYTNSFFIFGVSEPLIIVVTVLAVNYFCPKFWLSPVMKFIKNYDQLKFLADIVPKNCTWFDVFMFTGLTLAFYTFIGFPYEMYKKNKNKSKLIKLMLYLLFNCILPPMLVTSLPQNLHGVYAVFVSSIGGLGVVFIIINNLKKANHSLFYTEFYFHYLFVLMGYGLVLGRKYFGLGYDKVIFNSVCFRNLLYFLTGYGIVLGLIKTVRVIYEIKTHLGLPFFTTKRPKKTE